MLDAGIGLSLFLPCSRSGVLPRVEVSYSWGDTAQMDTLWSPPTHIHNTHLFKIFFFICFLINIEQNVCVCVCGVQIYGLCQMHRVMSPLPPQSSTEQFPYPKIIPHAAPR